MSRPNEKEAIYNIQRYLRQLSYHDETIPPPPIDGVFDSATANALRAFQASEGLAVTGTANKETFDLLYERFTVSLKENAAPIAIALFPRSPTGFTVKEGDSSFLVALIQFLLKELEILYAGLDAVPMSGSFDRATADAARIFQQKHNLPQTGEIDRATWDAMANAYNRTFSGYFDQ